MDDEGAERFEDSYGETIDLDTLEPVLEARRGPASEAGQPSRFSDTETRTQQPDPAPGPKGRHGIDIEARTLPLLAPIGPATEPARSAVPAAGSPHETGPSFAVPTIVPPTLSPPANGAVRPVGRTPISGPEPPRRPATSLQVARPTMATVKTRQKVALEPGFGPLDWEKLKRSGSDLAGSGGLKRYTVQQLAEHRTEGDCWMAIQGKIYNVTPYLRYHPGGVKELLRGAGRDATKLFMDAHSWVNVHLMLDKCLVGFLVGNALLSA
ncbi:cytochrome b5-like heme/steroid binding domain-containing protein [Hyaloraphidium curvatum]|nr:cytochrome b5-like heme/steroid binding domain-containing protein [Hyaloraphidium curvatum]